MKLSLARLRLAPLLVLAACGGSADAADTAPPGESDEGALATGHQILPGVVAIELEPTAPGAGRKTIGATAKTAKVMRALTKRTGRDPACPPGSPRTQLNFFNDKGEAVGTGSFACMVGKVTLANDEVVLVNARTNLIHESFDAPLVPADALWGITKIAIHKLANVGDAPPGEVTIEDDAGLRKVLDAMDADQEVVPQDQLRRCRPTHSIGFMRMNKDVAYASYVCHLDEIPTTLPATFTIVDPRRADADPLAQGRITIHPRAIEAVYAAGLPGRAQR